MGSAVLEGGGTDDIHEYIFQAAKVQICNVLNCKWVYLLIVRNGIFMSGNVQIIAVTSWKRVDFLIFTNSDFRVRNVIYVQC